MQSTNIVKTKLYTKYFTRKYKKKKETKNLNRQVQASRISALNDNLKYSTGNCFESGILANILDLH